MRARALYRLNQFRRALGACPTPRQLATARGLLTDAQWRLFTAMAPRDQWHAVETLHLLGPLRDDADVAAAALLHDAGKGFIRLHERVIYVLALTCPPVLRLLAAPCGTTWRTALHRSFHHPAEGAALALKAGASARTAELIRRHHAPDSGDAQAMALFHADERA